MRFRRLYSDKIYNKIDLHIFPDASLESMCIVAYMRAADDDGMELSFVIGKCRVTLMKKQTIPQLELQVALYSVRQAIENRRPRYPNPDSDTLHRLHDGSPVVLVCPKRTPSVRGQQGRGNTGSIQCRRLARCEGHNEYRGNRH